MAVVICAALSCSRTTELLPTPVGACQPIHLGGTDPQSCTGALSARFGRYALCTCDDLTVSGNLSIGGPGSSPKGPGGPGPGPGAPAPPASTAAVGTDGNLRVMGLTEVAGSLVTAGAGGATFVRGGHIQGNLRGGGSFTTMTTMGVWVSGEMSSVGDVSGLFKVVGGPLRVPAAAMVSSEVQSMGLARQPVSVASPCDCGAPAIDLAAAVEARRTHNANVPVFSGMDLAAAEQPVTLEIPCGEYYLPEIRTGDAAAVELRVHGIAAIFVAGDVQLGNNFIVTLDPGAELDLVVAGSFFMRGLLFGSPSSPARTRLWIGGLTASLPDQIQFGAAVYAPSAAFSSAGVNFKFSGSLYVRSVLVKGEVLHIAYDPEITQSGELCGATPPPSVD